MNTLALAWSPNLLTVATTLNESRRNQEERPHRTDRSDAMICPRERPGCCQATCPRHTRIRGDCRSGMDGDLWWMGFNALHWRRGRWLTCW